MVGLQSEFADSLRKTCQGSGDHLTLRDITELTPAFDPSLHPDASIRKYVCIHAYTIS